MKTQIIKGEKHTWELVIGLEVHAQVKSNSKLFSGSSTKFGGEPNSQVSLIDAAMPGMLPVINGFVVEQAVKSGLGIKAKINNISVFDRKNYFYPDLPQGYQISQFYYPIVSDGIINISNENGENKVVRVERIHLEQDAGKSIHDASPNNSLIDLNRSGIALMEIVSRPDIRSSFEAGEYVKKLRQILRYLDTCDGDMEKGSLRCDANVSVRIEGEEKLGTRCEIKNLNSIRNIMLAIDYEARRQIEILENGGAIDQETRLFDPNLGETRTMRSKEDAFDYRYFPDPDLLPLKISDDFIARIRSKMPELPDEKKTRYVKDYGLSEYDADTIIADIDVANYFENVAKKCDPKLASNWITAELFGRLNKTGESILDTKVTSDKMIGLLNLIKDGTISGKIAKDVLDIMVETGDDADKIVQDKGLVQMSDSSELIAIIDKVIAANADKKAEYLSGKDKLFGFFVGQVMKETGGKANPKMVNDLLKERLK